MYPAIPAFGNFATTASQVTPYVVTTRTEDLLNYVNGNPLVEQDSFVSEMGTGALFMGGIQAAPHIFHPIKSFKAARDTNTFFKSVNGLKNMSNANIASAYSSYYNALKSGAKIAECNKGIYNTALQNLQKAIQSGNQAKIIQYSAELNHVVTNGKNPGLFRRFFTYAKSFGKERAAATEVTKAATKKAGKAAVHSANAAKNATGLLGKTKNVLASGGFVGMVLIDGAIETITEVIPTFTKLSAEKGFKQLGKSAVNVAASAGGWVAGAKGGTAAGAAIGTAICPGIGTAIGGAIGSIVGGLLGSWSARKLSKVVTGKTELEKAAEQETREQAVAVSQSPEDMQTLLAMAHEKAMAEGGADAEIAMNAIQDIQKNMPIKTAAPTFGIDPSQQTAQLPNFNYPAVTPSFNGSNPYTITNPFNPLTLNMPFTTPNFGNVPFNLNTIG